IGARRDLGDRERLREVRIGHPVLHFDDAAVNLGNQCVYAANRQKRKKRELPRQLGEDRCDHRGIVHHAIAIDIGASTASTHSSGSRKSAMAMKVSTHMTICHGMPLRACAILRPVAMMSPVAAAETPVVAPRTPCRSANLA